MTSQASRISGALKQWVTRGRVITFDELSFLSGGAAGLGSVSVSKHVASITDDDVPWWRVVKTRALTRPLKGFLQPTRSKAQAERLKEEGVHLGQPLRAREEVRRYSDVRNDNPFHPLSHLVQTQVLDPVGPHKRTLIWLHGRDGTALRCACLPLWDYQRASGTKIVLPSAPLQRDVNGRLSFCWFRSGEEDPALEEVEQVATDVVDVLTVEGSAVGPENIYIGGCSQGGMLAIHLGASLGTSAVCGVIALNAWKLPCTITSISATKLPRLLKFNGDADTSVDAARAKASFKQLNGMGVVDIDHPTQGVAHAIAVADEKKLILKAMLQCIEKQP